jgi:hypothetical protein
MSNKIKKYILASALAAGIPASAFGVTPRPSGNLTKIDDFFSLFQAVALWLYAFAFSFAVIMLLWAGYLYLTAQDDEKQIEKAKHTIMYAVIGIIVAVLANGTPKLISSFLGV